MNIDIRTYGKSLTEYVIDDKGIIDGGGWEFYDHGDQYECLIKKNFEYQLKTDSCAFTWHNGPTEFKISDKKNGSNDIYFNGRIWFAQLNRDSILSIGSSKGYFELNIMKNDCDPTYRDYEITEANTYVRDMDSRIDGITWMAITGKGIAAKTKNKIHLLSHEILSEKLFNGIGVENDSIIWAATTNGLLKIKYHYDSKKDSIHLEKIDTYTTNGGLPSNYIEDICFWNNSIWVATAKGVSYFDPASINQTFSKPKIILKKIEIRDGQPLNQQQPYKFKPNENDFKISYAGISLNPAQSKPYYKYTLFRKGEENKSTVWNYTNESTVTFFDVHHGRYEFKVLCRTEGEIWSDPLEISFQIKPVLTQRIWFQAVTCLGFGGYYIFTS